MSDPFLASLNDDARCIAIALFLFTALQLLRDRFRYVPARLGAALAVGAAAYVLNNAPALADRSLLWRAPLIALDAGNMLVFWVFARRLLDDDFRLRLWHAAVWILLAALGVLNRLVLIPQQRWGAVALAGNALTLATLGFGLLVFWHTVRNWREDLVEPRRRLRLAIVLVIAAYTIPLALATFAAGRDAPSVFGSAGNAVVLAAIALFLAWQLLQVRPEAIDAQLPPAIVSLDAMPSSDAFDADPAAVDAVSLIAAGAVVAQPSSAQPHTAEGIQTAFARATRSHDGFDRGATATVASEAERLVNAAANAHSAADPQHVRRLVRLMQTDQVWREDGLSIGALAQRMQLPEYRLRRLINQGLGYRNFSAFLAAYRIAATRAVLADPAQRDAAVLTIALDAGFQSLGPFNRAFKHATGMTPTEFRRAHAADDRPADT